MRLQQYIEEMKYAEFITLWEVQQQFHGPLNSILDEIFNKNIKLKIEKDSESFTTYFHIDESDWIFMARDVKGDGTYSILFNRRDDSEMFKSKGNTKFPGDIFSGVFRSIKKLLNDRQVDGIYFNTDDNRLKSLYTKMKPFIEKRFPEFEFSKKNINGKFTEFLYLRKEE